MLPLAILVPLVEAVSAAVTAVATAVILDKLNDR